MMSFLHICKRYGSAYCIIIYSTLIFTGITLFGILPCHAQTNRIKILFERLKKAKQDTDRVNIYYSLSRQYWTKNADSALLMAQKSLDLAQKIHFEKGIALAYVSKGVALGSKGKLPEALECHFQSLRLSEKLGMEGLSGNEYDNIGIVYAGMDDYVKALYYYQQAYKIALKQHDPTGFVTFGLLVNMGEIFKKKGQPDSTIAYNQRALVTAKKAKDSVSIAIALYNIGENYVTKKNYKQAQAYLDEALDIAITNWL